MSGGKFRSVESPETNDFSEVLDDDLSSAASEFSVRNLGFQGNEVEESGTTTRSSQPGGSSCGVCILLLLFCSNSILVPMNL